MQSRLHLDINPSAPLVAFIGRLEDQKGADIVLKGAPQLFDDPSVQGDGTSSMAGLNVPIGGSSKSATAVPAADSNAPIGGAAKPDASVPALPAVLQLVMLGSGQPWQEAAIRQLGTHYPGRAAGIPAFNEPLAHLLMAAADYLLVPSRFEPCGLVALSALRYGTICIAADTGGLADIVRPELGYLIPQPEVADDYDPPLRESAALLVHTVRRALAAHQTPAFDGMRRACMQQDVSWDRQSAAWEAALLGLTREQPDDGSTGEAPEQQQAQ